MLHGRNESYNGPSRVVVHLRSLQADCVDMALCPADVEMTLADFRRALFRTLEKASQTSRSAERGQLQWVLPPLQELGGWQPTDEEADGSVLGTFDTDNETSEDSVASEYSVEEKPDGTVTHSAERRPSGFGVMRVTFDDEMRAMLEEASEDFVFWRLRSLPIEPEVGGQVTRRSSEFPIRKEEWLTDDNMVLYSVGQVNKEDVVEVWIRRRSEAPPPQLECLITRTELVQDLWANRYTVYLIALTFGSLRWSVSRRFSEFVDLHNSLSAKTHASATGSIKKDVLPALPPKIFGRNRSLLPAVVETRRRQLQDFLDCLLQSPEAAGNIHVLKFLGVMSTSRHLGKGLAPEKQPQAPPRQVIHLSKLRGHVPWGSVILFKCANTLSGLQRTVTGAEWDHVAFVARSRSGAGLELIEATGDGVRSYPFVARISAYAQDFVDYMVIRQLHFDRTLEALENSIAFIQAVEGLEYGFSLSNLVARFRSSKISSKAAEHTDEEKVNDSAIPSAKQTQGRLTSTKASEENTFFCSELVAAFLVAIGALPRDTNCAYFWPGSFAQGGEVDRLLLEDFHFGEEVLIDTKIMEIGSAITEREKSEMLRRRRMKARWHSGRESAMSDLWATPPSIITNQIEYMTSEGSQQHGTILSSPESLGPNGDPTTEQRGSKAPNRTSGRSGGSIIARLLGADRNF